MRSPWAAYKLLREKQGVWLAASKGDIDAVLALLDKGGDVDEEFMKSTPVQVAAKHGHVEMARLLLEKGANPNPDVYYRGAALADITRAGSGAGARILLEHGADPDASDPEHQISALMYAAASGNLDVVRALVDCGADINAQNYEGRTALTYARRDHPDAAQFIRDNGGTEREDWAAESR